MHSAAQRSTPKVLTRRFHFFFSSFFAVTLAKWFECSCQFIYDFCEEEKLEFQLIAKSHFNCKVMISMRDVIKLARIAHSHRFVWPSLNHLERSPATNEMNAQTTDLTSSLGTKMTRLIRFIFFLSSSLDGRRSMINNKYSSKLLD